MKLSRHELRREAIMILFKIDFYEGNFSLDELKNYSADYADTLDFVNGYLNNTEQIDSLIKSNLFNYTISRLNIVDRAIIRLAVSEMICSSVAHSIIINEALLFTEELSDLGDKKQVRFNNKLLDSIAKSIADGE